jgi:hypothetical protein
VFQSLVFMGLTIGKPGGPINHAVRRTLTGAGTVEG